MKSKLQTYLQSAAILLALTLLFSLIFAALYYFTWISAETFHILNWIGGAIAYGCGGVWLGIKTKKKAMFSALGMILLFCIPVFLLSGISLLSIIEMLSKALAFIACCMLMYAKTQAKA